MVTRLIPGFGKIELHHLVLDYNGTLALDGTPLPGVREILTDLSRDLTLHVITADTHGQCRDRLRGWPVGLHILGSGPEDEAKLGFVRSLGCQACACVGNGRNDRLMLRECALGIAVLGEEGTAVEALNAADIVAPGILPALRLLGEPKRLTATLRC